MVDWASEAQANHCTQPAHTFSLFRCGHEDNDHGVASKLLHIAAIQQQQINDLQQAMAAMERPAEADSKGSC